MLRIEEIVGAMDDEFRYALDAMDSDRLTALAADRAALRRIRPVGVSTDEALQMIHAILERRAQPPKPKPKPRPRKPRAAPPTDPDPTGVRPATTPSRPRRRKAKPAEESPADGNNEPTLPLGETAPTAPEPRPRPATAQPRRLTAPPDHDRLAPPAAGRPAIRLGPPPTSRPAILVPPSRPPPQRAPMPTIAIERTAPDPELDREEASPGGLRRLHGVVAVLALAAALAAMLTWL